MFAAASGIGVDDKMSPRHSQTEGGQSEIDLPSVDKLPRIDASGDTMALPTGEVHVWCCFSEDVRFSSYQSAWEGILTPDEAASRGRFVFERDQQQFLAARALVRWVLSHYACVEPAAWRFTPDQNGKPRISWPSKAPRLDFNLSHTRGLVACAVSARSVGVDVENMHEGAAPLDIAEDLFSHDEVRDLRSLPTERQRTRFYSYWTLKESYLKARGLGLAIPLEQFSFDLEDYTAIRIRFAPAIDDDPGCWRFALLRASTWHVLAISAAGSPHTELRLRYGRCIPLHGVVT